MSPAGRSLEVAFPVYNEEAGLRISVERTLRFLEEEGLDGILMGMPHLPQATWVSLFKREDVTYLRTDMRDDRGWCMIRAARFMKAVGRDREKLNPLMESIGILIGRKGRDAKLFVYPLVSLFPLTAEAEARLAEPWPCMDAVDWTVEDEV